MDPGAEERLVHVDVPESRDQMLVQQHGFDLPWPSPQGTVKPCRAESRFERFLPESLSERFDRSAGDNRDPPKLPLIPESQIHAVVQLERQMLEANLRILAIDDQESPCHPQMDDHPEIIVKIEQEILPPAVDVDDLPSQERGDWVNSVFALQDTGEGFASPHGNDRATLREVRRYSPHRFDFR
jgi:hypothetical protein